ncbi:hypothetical protein N24_2971 [Corynebacterium suranareeae]|uniref:Uncharacterized protein n=1 Tax=Corynebacterium suranareeae TaxID=2506452 RepID=A0A169S758_9CORY|nr:hypothetical protein N24_2971 [Corynebacterium suranareeae]
MESIGGFKFRESVEGDLRGRSFPDGSLLGWGWFGRLRAILSVVNFGADGVEVKPESLLIKYSPQTGPRSFKSVKNLHFEGCPARILTTKHKNPLVCGGYSHIYSLSACRALR